MNGAGAGQADGIRVISSPFSPFSRREWAVWLRAMLAAIPDGAEGIGVELLLVRDADIAVLNERYLGCRGATNSLSFPEQSTGHGKRLGSLVLSVDALHRECLLYGQEAAVHGRRLLAHGLAHLLGYDHGVAMDRVCDQLEAAAALDGAGLV